MKILQVIVFASLSVAVACSSKTNVATNGQTAPPSKEEPQKKTEAIPVAEKTNPDTSVKKTTAPDNDTYRFIVGFYSIGSGTEGKEMEKFETFASEYGQKAGKQIPIEKYQWGREGEVDFCLKLESLPPNEQEVFISRAKTVLKDAKWVHFFENSVCKHKR